MEKTRGDLSFNPGRMMLLPYGHGSSIDIGKFERDLIAQNILLACYYERCSAEEISLQLGVAVPYLENALNELCAGNVLVQKGGRYETDVVIFTKDFAEEAEAKTVSLQREIAEVLDRFLDEYLPDIKAVGFHQGGMDDELLRWHTTQLVMEQAVLEKYEESLNLVFPTKYGGYETFIIGVEDFSSRRLGGLTTQFENTSGDRIKALEFFVPSIHAKLDMGYFFEQASRTNIALGIAKGKTGGFSENDALEVAEFIKNGWAKKDGDKIRLCIPVYTAEQYERVVSIMDAVTSQVADITRELIKISTDILVQHTPAQMKKDAKAVGWLKRHDIAMSGPVEIMRSSGMLRRVVDNEHPTMYVVLR